MKGRAVADILLVEVDEASEKSANGIILVGNLDDKFREGKVISVGEGRITNDGVLQSMRINIGDTVYFPAFLKKKIKLEGKEYFVINQENVVYVKGE